MFGILGLALAAARLEVGHLQPDGTPQAADDLILHLQNVPAHGVEPFRLQAPRRERIDEPGVHPHLLAIGQHASFEHVANVELAPDAIATVTDLRLGATSNSSGKRRAAVAPPSINQLEPQPGPCAPVNPGL